MKKCLISGVSGLVGSHLISQLTNDYFVIGLSRSQPKLLSISNQFKHLEVDLSQSLDVNILPSQIDTVIHLAQSDYFRQFPNQVENVFYVNTVTTLNLLDYARRAGAKTFILASSGGIYGHGDQEFSEDVEITPKGNLGFYLGTKLCSEIVAENYTSFFNIIILRFFFVYGSGQKQSMLIPRLINSVLAEKPIVLQGQDGIRLNPTHVSDVVTAIIDTLKLEGSHKINIAGPEILTLRQIAETISLVLNKQPNFEIRKEEKPRHLVGDIQKMSRLLTPPKVKFADGIKLLNWGVEK